MVEPDLQQLQRELLQGGVRPRLVRRTIAELRDHYRDLEYQALATGAHPLEAELQARTALGDSRLLRDSILSRQELKSWSARYPVRIYLLSPVLTLLLIMAASLAISLALANAGFLSTSSGGAAMDWLRMTVQCLFLINDKQLTPLLAVLYCLFACHRHARSLWPAAGILLLAFVGSGWELSLHIPDTVNDTGTMQLTWGYAFLGIPLPEGHTMAAVLRLLSTTGLTAMTWLLYQAVQGQHTMR